MSVRENLLEGAPAASQEEALGRIRMARHPDRPYALDYIERLFSDFVELHGDRRYADDQALICGFANYHDIPVVVIAQQKGRDTKQRRLRNFAMPKPEGYRKALRVMRLAEKFGRPVITLVDTPGAYPGIDAEERGQAEAIANNLLVMSRLNVPVIVAIIGEGGSGGALAIAVGDVVQMMENAIYSVISPEGCAAILWKDASQSGKAAQSLRVTARDLHALGIIDLIIPEPGEGAHTSHDEAARRLDEALHEGLRQSLRLPAAERLARRYEKIRSLGF